MLVLTAAFTALVASAGLAAAASTVQCAEAARFGVFTISPTSAKAGDTLTITADFTCGFQLGYPPVYTDYYIEAAGQGSVLLARRTFSGSASAPTDTFTAKVPDYYYSTSGGYSVQLHNTFSHTGPAGGQYLSVGQIGDPITILSS